MNRQLALQSSVGRLFSNQLVVLPYALINIKASYVRRWSWCIYLPGKMIDTSSFAEDFYPLVCESMEARYE